MLQPCNPEVTINLLRHALNRNASDADLELIIDLVAQLVTDLKGGAIER